MAKVKIGFKNVLDKRVTYKRVEKTYLIAAVKEYARLYCEDHELYKKVIHEKVVIRLNGKVVGVDDWVTTTLEDDDKILIIPTLEGDTGIIQAVVGVILLVVAYFVPIAAGYLIPLGLSLLLGAAMSFLTDTDLPTTFSGIGGNSKGSTTYSWGGMKTSARPDHPIPIVYGKHMVGGNLISIFTERQGADDYLFMLIALAEGEIEGICVEGKTDTVCTTSDPESAAYKWPYITLQDQPFQNYTDVQWWFRNGTNLPDATKASTDPSAQNIIPHFSGSRLQMDDGRPLSIDGVIYTTTKEVDMATIQVKFPSMYDGNGGSVNPTTVNYGIEFRKFGDSNWIEYAAGRYDPVCTAELRSSGEMSPLRSWNTGLRYTSAVPGVQAGNAFALTEQKPDSFRVKVLYRSVLGGVDPDIIGKGYDGYYIPPSHLISDFTLQYNNLVTGEMWQEVIRYMQPVQWTFPQTIYDQGYWGQPGPTVMSQSRITLGPYDAELPQQLSVGDTYTFSSASSGQFWRTITNKSKTGFWDTNTIDFHTESGGEGKQVYDIKVRRETELSTDFQVQDQALLNSVIEVLNGDFIYPNTALLGFKIKATDQLSGSAPNVNVMIKGTKIDVPDHNGSENFEELFWDADNDRWEHDGQERTWDNTTYVKEYCNNSMLCLKDLMTNKRYGLGEYTEDNDFNDANTIAIMKECHLEYNPTQGDYVKWWTAGNPTEFIKSIEDSLGAAWKKTLTISGIGQTVAYEGAYSHWIPFRLDAPLKSFGRYRLSITLGGTSHNTDIYLSTKRAVGHSDSTNSSTWYQMGDPSVPEITDVGNGTHTYDFTAGSAGAIKMLVSIQKHGSPANISGTVVDISVDAIQGSGRSRAWHYHTYNGVFDAKQAALTALMEFSSSFRVWPAWYEGTFKFIMDKDETPIHTLAVSNTISFTQSWVPLSEIPYRIIGQYTDEDQKYDLTQIMVQSTDNTIPKTSEQTVGLKGITNRKRAEREIKFALAKLKNNTHGVTIRCGMDMIHATAGDIINISNDLPQWGHGTRVASFNQSSKYIYLVEPYLVTDATPIDIMIKFQDANNEFQTASLNMAGISDGDILRRVTTKSWPGDPNINGPAIVGINTSYVKKFRLMSVTRNSEEEMECQALEHIDTLYAAEPVLVVAQDYETQTLNQTVTKPGKVLDINIIQLLPTEGIGWDIQAEHPDLRSQEIVISMGEEKEVGSSDGSGFITEWHQIGIIAQGQHSMRYINNTLKTGAYYSFKFYAKNQMGSGPYVYQTILLDKYIYTVAPPTGLQIKGSNPLNQTWDGLDVTIKWNPVGQSWYQSGLMDFYTLYVYKDNYDGANPGTNLIRTAYPKKTEYKYTYDMNIEDNGADSLAKNLIFVITANLVNGVESPRSRPFQVLNAAPSQPTNFTSEAWMRTVTFKWSPNSGTDFKHFKMRHKITDTNSTPIRGNWSTWETKTDNTFVRTITGTEINTFGERTRVYFEVKALDLYNSSSNVASGNKTTQTLNIQTVDIASFAVASIHLISSSVIMSKIAAGAVGSDNIVTNAITTSKIEALAIESDKVAANAIVAGKIAANTVVATVLAANSVIGDKIAANAVTAGKINVASLSAITADIGIVTAGLAKSSDGRMQVDFTNKWIKVFDTSATLRVQIGFIP